MERDENRLEPTSRPSPIRGGFDKDQKFHHRPRGPPVTPHFSDFGLQESTLGTSEGTLCIIEVVVQPFIQASGDGIRKEHCSLELRMRQSVESSSTFLYPKSPRRNATVARVALSIELRNKEGGDYPLHK